MLAPSATWDELACGCVPKSAIELAPQLARVATKEVQYDGMEARHKIMFLLANAGIILVLGLTKGLVWNKVETKGFLLLLMMALQCFTAFIEPCKLRGRGMLTWGGNGLDDDL